MTKVTMVPADSAVARSLVEAIQRGDVDSLAALLRKQPGLATARFGDESESRTALHIATDWPGHFPRVADTIEALVAAGADVDGRYRGAPGSHRETALHWAASSNDVDAIVALLDAGADIEADGAVLTDGTALADAVLMLHTAHADLDWLGHEQLTSRQAGLQSDAPELVEWLRSVQ
jgi:uncharacterized protein